MTDETRMKINRPEYLRQRLRLMTGAAILIVMTAMFVAAQQTRQMERETQVNPAERRVALVIGNANYQYAPKLANPANDAADIAKALKEDGFEVLSDTDLNKRQMENLIRDFGTKLLGGGVGLFYYAGHGIQVAGENYLVPIDAEIPEEDEINYAAVPVDLVLRKMTTAKNDLNIIILDACRNNPFARSWRGFRDVGNTGGLARLSPPSGTLVLYATQPGKVASDGAKRNGLFTEALLNQINKADLEYDQMVKTLSAEVWQKSNKQQLPWKEGISLTDFYFAGKSDPPAPGVQPKNANVNVAASSAELIARWKLANYSKENIAAIIVETTAELSLNPKNAIALRLRSMAYHLSNNVEKSRQDAVDVLDLIKTPSTSDEFEARCYAERRLEKYDEALLNCTKAITSDRTSSWAYNGRGILYNDKKLYDLAVADFTKAIELEPLYAAAYYNRGGSYALRHQYDLAIADYNKAIEFNPRDTGAYYDRGNAYFRKQQYDLALVDYSKTIGFDPMHAAAYNNRGYVYYHKQQYDPAIFDYNKAIELNPGYASAYNNRGIVYNEKNQYDLALADFNKAIELNAEYVAAFINRGLVYKNKQQYDLAIADYNKAIELDPKSAFTYNNRGIVYTSRQQYDPALADLTKAIGLSPGYTEAYVNRGVVYYYKQQYNLAIADFNKAIELDPKHIMVHRNRADAYDAKGEKRLAAADRKKADELEGQSKP